MKTLRIGCGAGFWGDTTAGPAQLVRRGKIDVLVLDYLAEITMSILARMKQKSPDAGYATDFVEAVMLPLAKDIAEKKVKVVTNAGGVNPIACRDALSAGLAKLGVSLKIAVVTGDDLSGEMNALRAEGVLDTETGGPLPAQPLSANAYLGAAPIAEAIRRGADVVITGRCVDSALALGPLLATFGWSDLHRLAQGCLAGHVIECGAQATGGIYTDWHDVEAGWEEMGFPIVEVSEDGSFVVEKPEGTGGLVSPDTVAEQVVYEVHDPANYALPDVVCDFSNVRLEAIGNDRVRVTGARGLPPPPTLKASITYADGFRVGATVLITGHEARAKAERTGQAILARAQKFNEMRGLGPFTRTSIEMLGSEFYFGDASRATGTREVVLALAATHKDKNALELLAREIAPAGTSMVQSLSGFAGGRPSVAPVVRLASCLVPRDRVAPKLLIDGETIDVPAIASDTAPVTIRTGDDDEDATIPDGPRREVPLRLLAHGRSGDKGNTSNIGVLARKPQFVPILRAALTTKTVARYFAHFVHGKVTRFEWPGLDGFNIVMHDALGGGGMASLRHDPQGKGLAQILLEMPISIPEGLVI